MAPPNPPKTEHYVAAVFGVTGLVGRELARRLTSRPARWKKVYGIARNPDPTESLPDPPNFHFIQCDLQNPSDAQRSLSLSLRDVTHVFWVTWASQSPYDTRACCAENESMLSNALNALVPAAPSLQHVSLQTGLKHYIHLRGPFKAEAEAGFYYHEECPRADDVDEDGGGNFYYVLEDLLKERLRKRRIAWSVHRPGLIMGSSCRAFYNVMGCLGVYGTICRHLKLSFVFGGARRRWDGFYLDGSDARLVAEQHMWAATSEGVGYCENGVAFNAVNGAGFTWEEVWPRVGERLGVGEIGGCLEEYRYVEAMEGMGGVWEEIVEKEGLVKTKIEDLANWEFLDMLFRCPVKLLGTRDKADRLGFTVRYETLDSILYWLEAMRVDKLIPY